LAFAALHNIKPVSEKFPLTGEGIEDALDKLEKGTIRYRGVLVAEALKVEQSILEKRRNIQLLIYPNSEVSIPLKCRSRA